MTPLLLAVMLAAPVPKAEAVKPESITERNVAFLRDNRVQRELGLSAEHRVTLIDYFEKWDEENFRFFCELNPPSGPAGVNEKVEEMKKKRLNEFSATQWEAMRQTVANCLTTSQYTRLRQLERRHLMVLAFEQKETAQELTLTAEQRTAIRKLIAEYRENFDKEYNSGRKPSGLSFASHAKPFLVQVLDTLTEAQQKRWQELIGAEPKIATASSPRAATLLRAAIQHDIDLPTLPPADR